MVAQSVISSSVVYYRGIFTKCIFVFSYITYRKTFVFACWRMAVPVHFLHVCSFGAFFLQGKGALPVKGGESVLWLSIASHPFCVFIRPRSDVIASPLLIFLSIREWRKWNGLFKARQRRIHVAWFVSAGLAPAAAERVKTVAGVGSPTWTSQPWGTDNENLHTFLRFPEK